MEWPLPLWIVLEEESEALQRNRAGLWPEFSRLIEWEFTQEDIIDPGRLNIDLIARREYIRMALEERPGGTGPAINFLDRPDQFPLMVQGIQNPRASLADFLNELLQIRNLYQPYWDIPDAYWVQDVVVRRAPQSSPLRVNRYLLESAYPHYLRRTERFEDNQIRDRLRLLEQMREPKQRSRLSLVLESQNAAAIMTARQVLNGDTDFTEAEIAVALNQFLGISNLHEAFPHRREASWVKHWLIPPDQPPGGPPPAENTHPPRDSTRLYDPSHGNRILLEGVFPQTKSIDDVLLKHVFERIHARQPTAALCLSGGGIRSATFALGVVQAFAAHKLLATFDYFSTVSGGGYLGGWLSAWINRNPQRIAGVSQELSRPKDSKREPESDPLYYLREFSNYLAPRVGLLSGDTWTLAAIYLRNLFLDWLILIPLFALLLMVPAIELWILRLHLSTVGWTPVSHPVSPVNDWRLAICSLLLGVISIGYAALAAPTSSSQPRLTTRLVVGQGDQRSFLLWCLLPRLFAALLFAWFWYWHAMSRTVAPSGSLPLSLEGGIPRIYKFLAYGALLGFGGWLIFAITVRKAIAGMLVFLVVSGAVAGLLLDWGSRLDTVADFATGDKLYVCLSVPLFLLAMVTADAVFQGLASRYMSDADREWVARSAAWILIAAIIWLAITSIALFGPSLLLSLKFKAIPLAAVSGLVSLLGSWSSKTPAAPPPADEPPTPPGLLDRLANYVLPILAFVFIIILGAALALGTETVLNLIAEGLGHRHHDLSYVTTHATWPAAAIGILVGILILIAVLAGFTVDINKFSMHAMYRERLIRAYLGASRERGARKPNGFTGLDIHDDVPMANLGAQQPLHLLNMTLNLVGGVSNRLAWQERKAESFTVSPLHSGNFWWGYRGTKFYGGEEGGIRLGTAVAISGAAASPNCGYASSALLTFLLTVFNARLGWWLGNPGPAGGSTFKRAAPKFAVGPLIGEAMGATNDYRRYVNLSDGGHFENLGLYEAVLRRCRYIVAVDASADPHYAFVDLAGAIRKIRTDLGIPILFEGPLGDLKRVGKHRLGQLQTSTTVQFHTLTHTKTTTVLETKYCAMATICYSAIDPGAQNGQLIYLKPTLRGDEPPDVLQYEKSHSDFPHESTLHQFFPESQFESYRNLGSYQARTILRNPDTQAEDDDLTIDELINRVRAYLEAPG